MSTISELREQIRVESRAAGFRSAQPVSDEAIRKRRTQISIVALVVFFGVVFSTMRANLWGYEDSWLDADLVKSAMITMAGGFIAYVVDKERHLRRLDLLGIKERELHLSAAESILDAAAFGEVEGELHESLLLEDVLDSMIDGAVELTGAESGTLYLLSDDTTPTVWSRRGEPNDGLSLASKVAASGKSMLVSRGGVRVVAGGIRMAAPVRVNTMFIGVIEVEPNAGWTFDAVDVELLERFCVRAGRALANSCSYEDALLGRRRNEA